MPARNKNFRTRSTRLALGSAACAAAFAAAAPVASADRFCVSDKPCEYVGGKAEPSVNAALNDASTTKSTDVIRVGAGTFHVQGYGVPGGANAVTIEGLGPSRTKLMNDQPDGQLQLYDGDEIAELTIDSAPGGLALWLLPGSKAAHVVVDGIGDGSTALRIDQALLQDSTATAPQSGTAIESVPGAHGSTLERDTLRAGTGVFLDRVVGFTAIRRSRIAAGSGIVGRCSDFGAEDDVIDIAGGNPRGVVATTDATCPGSAHYARVSHSTLVNRSSNALGIGAMADGGTSEEVQVSNTVVSGFETPLERLYNGGHDELDADWVATYGGNDYEYGANGTGALKVTHRITKAPRFADYAHHRYQLRFDSPLIDAGAPGKLGSLESQSDVLGAARLVDGDGNGVARRDIGAFEYQRRAPHLVTVKVAKSVEMGKRVRFRATGADPDLGDALTYRWTFGDGKSGTGRPARHRYSKPGTYAWAVRAVDPKGLRSKVVRGTIEVLPG